ncbi:restriction endonuclease subunit S [Micrococcus lylae]|uniref:Restriction endonuclease subunit S n=1 Tax=Micrococcus lylae TaxID=1273 RepID=A0ABY2JZX5_9MICC|nr:restriction endonuclease subunit S [Micrococcus lylae]TFH99581.1 restriction endonuclease subunit S [Micrococcus lylae]
MKPGWTTVALGDVAEVVMGQAPPGSSYNSSGEGLGLIAGAGDFKGGQIVPSKFTSAPGKISRVGDIVLSIRASIGAKVVADDKYCLGRGVAGIRATQAIDTRYLWHVMSWVEPDLRSKGRGATFLQVNRKDVAGLLLPLPPLDEQRRIAAILDVAKRVIASMGKSAVAEGAVRDSALRTLISNSTATVALGDQLDFLTSGPRGWGKFTTPDGFPFIRIQNIGRGRIELDGLARVTPPEGAEERRVRVQRDDVLLSITADLGRAGIVRDELIDGYISQHLAILRTRSLDPHFLAAFLESPEGVRQMRGANRGQTKDGLNFDAIRGLRIPVISTEKQSEFRRFCEQVEELRVRRSARQHRARGLFASLQSRAFRGEL